MSDPLDQEIDWTSLPAPTNPLRGHYFGPIDDVLNCVAEAADMDYYATINELKKTYHRLHASSTLPRTCRDLLNLLTQVPATATAPPPTSANPLIYDNDLSEKQKAEMFRIKFIDDDGKLVNSYLTHTRTSAKGWDCKQLLAPYNVIIQSSGVGKSRLVIETGGQCWLFYICFRKGQLGYPRCSHIFAHIDSLGSSIICTHEFYYANCHILFLTACILELVDHINSLKLEGKQPTKEQYQAWRDKQLTDDPNRQTCGFAFWEKIIQRHKVLIEQLNTQEMFTSKEKLEKVVLVEAVADSVREFRNACENFITAMKGGNNAMDVDVRSEDLPLVLFAFDEAQTAVEKSPSSIVSTFNLIRYALSSYPDNLKDKMLLFATMLDTHGQLSKLHPQNMSDASARFFNVHRLYPPFWPFPFSRCYDPFWAAQPAELMQNMASTFANSGRYLWKSMLEKGVTWDSLVSIACSKLAMKSSLVSSRFDNASSARMAVASVRLYLTFIASSSLIETLVRSHMAICTYVSREHNRMIIHYPSEPVLAVAANVLTVESPKDLGWKAILTELYEQIASGMVENGYRGELVARIILSYCWDLCWAEGKDSVSFDTARRVKQMQPVALETFLRKLGGQNLIDEIALSSTPITEKELLMKGKVFFTHFFYATASQTPESLEKCFTQSAAVLCKRCEQAIDLIIPVLLSDGRMSHVSVQVKNYAREKKTEEIVMLAFQNAGVLDICENGAPYLVLFLQVGRDIHSAIRCISETTEVRRSKRLQIRAAAGYTDTPVTTQQEQTKEAGTRVLVAMVGLSTDTYPGITPEIIHLLADISESWSDPIKYAKNTKYSFDPMLALKTWYDLNDPNEQN